jgi:hypothetical protein
MGVSDQRRLPKTVCYFRALGSCSGQKGKASGRFYMQEMRIVHGIDSSARCMMTKKTIILMIARKIGVTIPGVCTALVM